MGELADLIRPGAGRGLDFVILDDLRKRTGISVSEILKFSVAEMDANSLPREEISRCENCSRRMLSPVIIHGRHFCSVLCFERWKWRRERGGKDAG